MKKGDSGVVCGFQLVQDVFVKHKEGKDGMTRSQGAMQGAVVLQPEVAAKPVNDKWTVKRGMLWWG